MFMIRVHGDAVFLEKIRIAFSEAAVDVRSFDASEELSSVNLQIARTAADFSPSEYNDRTLRAVLNPMGETQGLILCPAQTDEVPLSLKQLVSALSRQSRDYENLQSVFDEVVSVGHHDFSEPARNITFFANLLGEGRLQEDKANDFLKRTEIAGQRLQNLIRDLTRYARVWLRPYPDEIIGPEEFPGLMEQAFTKAAARLHQSFQVPVLCGEKVRLNMPRRFLERILEELLANGLEHHPHEKGALQVHLNAHSELNRVQLSVSDKGPGIQIPTGVSLFRPFYRNERTDELRTGIGLALVKALTERVGGDVVLKPRDNQDRADLCLILPGQLHGNTALN